MERKREKLKIGILINSYFIPSWQLKIINEIKSSSYSEIALIIINNTSAIYASPDFSNITCKKRKIIYNVHLKLDELILGRNTDYSRILDSTTLLKDVASIIVTPIEHGFTDQLNKKDILEIKAVNLDIILKFGFKALSGDILQASKYGIWSYEPDKEVELLGYHEVVDKLQTTNSILQILEDGSNGGKIIHYSQMLTNYISISKNRNACYWRISTVIPHIIEGLYKSGDAYLQRLENKYKTDIHSRKKAISKTTSSIKALKNIFKHFSKVSKRIHQKIFFNDHWDVFYNIDSRRLLPALQEFKLLPTPSDRFWADPFVVSTESKHYVFVEELLYKTNKGHISVVELDLNGNFLSSEKILEKEYHLSYPFLFKCEDTYYMIPETGANKTIELYRCTGFPHKWEFVMNLMENVCTADVTLFYYNNKWWLFCCMDKTGRDVGMLDELHLFFSEDLFTQNWQSHPYNPINTNTRNARPAGRVFIKDDKIYRPSQDCSGIYGRAINLNQVSKLNETEYEERVIARLAPDEEKDIIGMHTFNSNDKITVIDGFRYRKRKLLKLLN